MVYFTNLSILFLYRRLFPIQSFQKASTVLIVAYTLWFIPGLVAETLMCTPISSMWLQPQLVTKKCFFYSTFFIIILSVELLLNAIMLALPILYVLNLKVSWTRRAELMVIFLLGGLYVSVYIPPSV